MKNKLVSYLTLCSLAALTVCVDNVEVNEMDRPSKVKEIRAAIMDADVFVDMRGNEGSYMQSSFYDQKNTCEVSEMSVRSKTMISPYLSNIKNESFQPVWYTVDQGNNVCSGTLIDGGKMLLTAMHCMFPKADNDDSFYSFQNPSNLVIMHFSNKVLGELVVYDFKGNELMAISDGEVIGIDGVDVARIKINDSRVLEMTCFRAPKLGETVFMLHNRKQYYLEGKVSDKVDDNLWFIRHDFEPTISGSSGAAYIGADGCILGLVVGGGAWEKDAGISRIQGFGEGQKYVK